MCHGVWWVVVETTKKIPNTDRGNGDTTRRPLSRPVMEPPFGPLFSCEISEWKHYCGAASFVVLTRKRSSVRRRAERETKTLWRHTFFKASKNSGTMSGPSYPS